MQTSSLQCSRAVGKDEPVMIAWTEYRKTEEYENSLNWCGKHSEGVQWASFVAGWLAAGGKL